LLIDSHLHINYNKLSLNDIIKYLDKEKIDLCWLLTWEEINPGYWDYKHLPVEAAYKAYQKYPSRIIPFYAPDPHQKQANELLASWFLKGIRGCGELKATLNWKSTEIESLLKVVSKYKMPLVFHMEESRYYDIPYSNAIFDKVLFYGLRTEKTIYKAPKYILQLLVNNYSPLKNRSKSGFFPGYMLDFASLESTLKDYPNINFVAHGLMFWKFLSADADKFVGDLPKGPMNGEGLIWRLLREYPNLYADISGPSGINAMTRDPQTTKLFLSTFEDKILYATDNFMKGQREFINSLNLAKTTCSKIYGENACKIMCL
jgi:predicted TIM-barrel fold metal-dependent hydrolase